MSTKHPVTGDPLVRPLTIGDGDDLVTLDLVREGIAIGLEQDAWFVYSWRADESIWRRAKGPYQTHDLAVSAAMPEAS